MRKKNIKMIGLDLDGTLLNDKKELTHYTTKVIQKAISQGVHIIVATGRPISGIPKEIINLPVRYLITVNGGRILDVQAKESLRTRLLPIEDAKKLLTIFDDYDAFREVYFDGTGYVDEKQMERIADFVQTVGMQQYFLRTRKAVANLWDKVNSVHKSMDKIQAIFANMEDCFEARERIAANFDLSVTNALPNNIEINPKGVNKAEALFFLADLLQIEHDEVMACGDGMNDLEMVESAGFGVVPDNACEEIKAVADYITASNNKHGIAKAIEKFVLTEEEARC